MNQDLLNWLLEDNNYVIKYRVQKEILKQNIDCKSAKEYIFLNYLKNGMKQTTYGIHIILQR